MIAIQQLTVTWDKRSRTPADARRRSTLPSSQVLPLDAVSSDRAFKHALNFNHERDYVPWTSGRELDFDRIEDEVAGLGLEFRNDELLVRFRWSPHVGAPTRSAGTRRLLSPGTWCQLRANGRLAFEDTWAYRDITLNVAFRPRDERVFTTTAPTFVDDHRADLW